MVLDDEVISRPATRTSGADVRSIFTQFKDSVPSRRIAMVGTYAPRKCGIATFGNDIVDGERIALDVSFEEAITDRPFAALRSMYITEFNADVARIAVREEGARGWREEPVMAFGRARATDVWTGRFVPSRHNTSAPDILFNRFRAGP